MDLSKFENARKVNAYIDRLEKRVTNHASLLDAIKQYRRAISVAQSHQFGDASAKAEASRIGKEIDRLVKTIESIDSL